MLAILGGSGWRELPGFLVERESTPETTCGQASAPVAIGRLNQVPLAFLPRHGRQHQYPPHRVNYRANIRALGQAGVSAILAINAVGAIHPEMPPGALVLPDQLIDYTWGRAHTFFDEQVAHIDFTEPFAGPLRTAVLRAAQSAGVPLLGAGVYGCVQGPRLETAAEIQRLRRDGCDLVGMTAMPEAALAREAGLDYACLCISVNWAAGLCDEPITLAAIHSLLAKARGPVQQIISALLAAQPAAAG